MFYFSGNNTLKGKPDQYPLVTRPRRAEKPKPQKKIPVKEQPPPQPPQPSQLPEPTPSTSKASSSSQPAASGSSSSSQPASQSQWNSAVTTTELYHTREWQMNEIEMLVNKQISDCGEDSLNSSELEIPRWCIHESSSGGSSSEEMEDLSDDVFLKRHARLEHDEKKRKKWDVQRIREMRNIERLRRRHYKNEIENNEQTIDGMSSFYPSPENVKFVQVADEIPVVAFGEPIHVTPPIPFSLPWNPECPNEPMRSQTVGLSNIEFSSIVLRPKKRPTRRSASSQLPRSSKRTKRQ